jgi:hypothetical protein
MAIGTPFSSDMCATCECSPCQCHVNPLVRIVNEHTPEHIIERQKEIDMYMIKRIMEEVDKNKYLESMTVQQLYNLILEASKIYTKKALKLYNIEEYTVTCPFCKYIGKESEYKFGEHPGGRQIWVHTCPECGMWIQVSEDYLERMRKIKQHTEKKAEVTSEKEDTTIQDICWKNMAEEQTKECNERDAKAISDFVKHLEEM